MRAKEFTINESVNLFEINMSPSSLRQLASGINAQAGMEFEMIVPNVAGDGDDESQWEPDYDEDVRARSIRQVVDFFDDNNHNGRMRISDLSQGLLTDYHDWLSEGFDPSTTEIIDSILELIDDNDVREILELPDDAEISRNDYKYAAQNIIVNEIRPLYHSAMDSLRSEWFEDDHEEEFLRETSPFMSDIERNYDITWPYYTTNTDGQDISEIASDFEAAIGRPVESSESYHSIRRKPNTYVVEPDGSLDGDNEGDRGLEFVSPPLPIAEMISDLQKVKQWADATGCYTNGSTGLHINVSIVGLGNVGENLDYVKLALLLGDEHVLNNFGRTSNRYAKSAMQKIESIVKSNPEVAEKMLSQMQGHLSGLASKAIHSGVTEKMISIHPKDGYIEFRSPGGDWLDENFDKIESALLRFVVALDAAMDPNKYRQEYLTKLYKLLQVQSSDDPMLYFAKHAAGQLPTSALKSFIRQIQRTRATQAASKLNSGPVTGEDAWVILADGVPQFRVRAKTQEEASTKMREWVSVRSYEWRVEHSGQNMEVVPFSAPETQALLRQYFGSTD